MNNSFASVHPELICEWSDKNAPLTPAQITYGSKKLYWWKGSCGHEWRSSAKSRSSGERCPYCAGMRVLPGYNDLASKRPELVKEWSPKNTLKQIYSLTQEERLACYYCEMFNNANSFDIHDFATDRTGECTAVY